MSYKKKEVSNFILFLLLDTFWRNRSIYSSGADKLSCQVNSTEDSVAHLIAPFTEGSWYRIALSCSWEKKEEDFLDFLLLFFLLPDISFFFLFFLKHSFLSAETPLDPKIHCACTGWAYSWRRIVFRANFSFGYFCAVVSHFLYSWKAKVRHFLSLKYTSSYYLSIYFSLFFLINLKTRYFFFNLKIN